MKKILDVFITINLAVFTVAIIYCVAVALFPIDIIQFKNDRQAVLNPNHQVHQGEDVLIQVNMCKLLPFPLAYAETHLQDGVSYDIEAPAQPIEMGCHSLVLALNIPPSVEIGHPLRVQRTLFYKLSPFGDPVKETWTSEDFTVVP